jgi:hypothetical protein
MIFTCVKNWDGSNVKSLANIITIYKNFSYAVNMAYENDAELLCIDDGKEYTYDLAIYKNPIEGNLYYANTEIEYSRILYHTKIKNLQNLFTLLLLFHKELNTSEWENIDFSNLPKFSKLSCKDTYGVYSYDDKYKLKYNGCFYLLKR